MHQTNGTTIEILSQLKALAENLSDDEFSRELPVLLNNSIGRHYRHVIEFYNVLISGMSAGRVNYDSRKHDPELEQNRKKCIGSLEHILSGLPVPLPGRELELIASYSMDTDESFKVSTNAERELVYNIEHAIHHMAIIRIGTENDFPHVSLPEKFGFAYSTIKHLKS